MLQDLIDLRKNGWVPRRVELKPQTMEQIQNEFQLNENQQRNVNYNNNC